MKSLQQSPPAAEEEFEAEGEDEGSEDVPFAVEGEIEAQLEFAAGCWQGLEILQGGGSEEFAAGIGSQPGQQRQRAHAVQRCRQTELRQPCRGYTSIQDGLEVGLRELARGRTTRKYGLIITDGVYTRGGDPTSLAANFPRLFVMLTEDYKMNEILCRRMAAVGRGDLFRVGSFGDLPRRMVDVADKLLR